MTAVKYCPSSLLCTYRIKFNRPSPIDERASPEKPSKSLPPSPSRLRHLVTPARKTWLSPRPSPLRTQRSPESKDMRAPILQHKKGKLSVTDLSSQIWCERQLLFVLETGIRRETAAMAAGTARHEILEKADHDVKEIEVSTPQDDLGLRLLNGIISFGHLLPQKRKVREVWVCGTIEGCVIRGVIDEIALEPEGELVIKDTKTRSVPTEPSAAQKRTSVTQLQTYRWMLDRLKRGELDWPLLFKTFKCDAEAPFEAEPLASKYENLIHLSTEFLRVMSTVAVIADHTKIEYECGGDIFHVATIPYIPIVAEWTLKELLDWWWGQRPAEPPLFAERWKCKRCDFLAACPISPLERDEVERVLEGRSLVEDIENLPFS